MPKTATERIVRIPEPGAPLPTVSTHALARIGYQDAWDLQGKLHQEMVALKLGNRDRRKTEQPELPQTHHLLYVEHPPVYTLGKSGSVDHLLMDEKQLAEGGFTYHKINRGGDITYHGPGQLVVYPIFDLDEFFTDVHRYVRCLEEVIIRTIADYGIPDAYREAGYTGVWLPATQTLPKRKICAIGVHLSRWVTMHGLAFNVNPDLSHFKNIVPCGIAEDDRDVTSLSKELGRAISLAEIQPVVDGHFRAVFGY
ncbi:lipoyl(octanoyl) transferase [Lewinellaceae bacterium SD302]|nr:lipoyl(octanoyl) transferase [Lewinellaceae bacterium SD302]